MISANFSRSAILRLMADETKGSGPKSPEMMALASAIVERYQFAQQHDLSFYDTATGTWKRNLSKALGYADVLRPEHYLGRYERGGIAEAIVEAYPNATWPLEMYVQEDEDPEVTTPLEEDAETLIKATDLWSVFWRADVLKELGHYSVILIGAPGRLDEELKGLKGPEDIQYLAPYGEKAARIESLVGESGTEEEMQDPRFGLPKRYEINFAGSNDEASRVGSQRRLHLTKLVHWSRVIHLAEGALENTLYGKPRLRGVWNLLDDLYKITGGGAEAAFRNMDPKRSWGVDPKLQVTPAMEEAMDNAIEEMRHGLESDLLLQGVKVDQLMSQVASFGPNAKAIIEQISATTGIPQRILMGSERGELASSQDSSNWRDRTDARWGRYGQRVVRELFDRLIEYGALSKPSETGYEIVRPPRDEPTDEMRASVTEKMARANQAHKNATGLPLFTGEQILDHVWDMEYLVEEADYQQQQPDDFFPPEEDEPDPRADGQGSGRPN